MRFKILGISNYIMTFEIVKPEVIKSKSFIFAKTTRNNFKMKIIMIRKSPGKMIKNIQIKTGSEVHVYQATIQSSPMVS